MKSTYFNIWYFCIRYFKKYILSIKILKIEYPILILSSILGMMVMISSNDLIIFYIGLELQSLSIICISFI